MNAHTPDTTRTMPLRLLEVLEPSGGGSGRHMLDLCREMGGPLMQGYLLARPELAPTTFNIAFPFEGEEDAWTSAEALAAGLSPAAETRVVRPQRQFGRRGV